MPDLHKSLGYQYLNQTKFTPELLHRQAELRITPASPIKCYPEAEKIPLDPGSAGPATDLWQLLRTRRSRRRFGQPPLDLRVVSLLCWASQGVTGRAGDYLFRTAPSAGALYPLETYLAVERVTGLAPGIYHLDVTNFQLEKISAEPPGAPLARAALGQNFIAQAGLVFLWAAELRRNMSKYGHRGLRYICMDAGHICQNLLLAAEALGLAACPVAAFFDDQINDLLGLDSEEESVLYLAPVGHRD